MAVWFSCPRPAFFFSGFRLPASAACVVCSLTTAVLTLFVLLCVVLFHALVLWLLLLSCVVVLVLFFFQTRHHEWIYGPNYGMVDCTLSRDGDKRPHITREYINYASIYLLSLRRPPPLFPLRSCSFFDFRVIFLVCHCCCVSSVLRFAAFVS